MKSKLILSTILFFSIFISCNRGNKKEDKEYATMLSAPTQNGPSSLKEIKKQKIPVGTLQRAETDSGTSPVPVKSLANSDWDKKIIKNATLKLEVKDFKSYNSDVHKTVKQFGGYIAQEEQNLTDEKSETVISIKVPVDQFETIMNQLPGGDVKVLERKITTEDVTGEVVDTKSRLEAKKQMRIKYLEFLKQSKNMEEVLQVQTEVNNVQEEIESAAGRVEFLSHQSSYSTINLTFFQPLEGYKPTDITPSFLTRVSNAFKIGTGWMADLFIGLIAIWPLLIIIIGIYLGWKKLRPVKTPKQIL